MVSTVPLAAAKKMGVWPFRSSASTAIRNSSTKTRLAAKASASRRWTEKKSNVCLCRLLHARSSSRGACRNWCGAPWSANCCISLADRPPDSGTSGAAPGSEAAEDASGADAPGAARGEPGPAKLSTADFKSSEGPVDARAVGLPAAGRPLERRLNLLGAGAPRPADNVTAAGGPLAGAATAGAAATGLATTVAAAAGGACAAREIGCETAGTAAALAVSGVAGAPALAASVACDAAALGAASGGASAGTAWAAGSDAAAAAVGATGACAALAGPATAVATAALVGGAATAAAGGAAACDAVLSGPGAAAASTADPEGGEGAATAAATGGRDAAELLPATDAELVKRNLAPGAAAVGAAAVGAAAGGAAAGGAATTAGTTAATAALAGSGAGVAAPTAGAGVAAATVCAATAEGGSGVGATGGWDAAPAVAGPVKRNLAAELEAELVRRNLAAPAARLVAEGGGRLAAASSGAEARGCFALGLSQLEGQRMAKERGRLPARSRSGATGAHSPHRAAPATSTGPSCTTPSPSSANALERRSAPPPGAAEISAPARHVASLSAALLRARGRGPRASLQRATTAPLHGHAVRSRAWSRTLSPHQTSKA